LKFTHIGVFSEEALSGFLEKEANKSSRPRPRRNTHPTHTYVTYTLKSFEHTELGKPLFPLGNSLCILLQC